MICRLKLWLGRPPPINQQAQTSCQYLQGVGQCDGLGPWGVLALLSAGCRLGCRCPAHWKEQSEAEIRKRCRGIAASQMFVRCHGACIGPSPRGCEFPEPMVMIATLLPSISHHGGANAESVLVIALAHDLLFVRWAREPRMLS